VACGFDSRLIGGLSLRNRSGPARTYQAVEGDVRRFIVNADLVRRANNAPLERGLRRQRRKVRSAYETTIELGSSALVKSCAWLTVGRTSALAMRTAANPIMGLIMVSLPLFARRETTGVPEGMFVPRRSQRIATGARQSPALVDEAQRQVGIPTKAARPRSNRRTVVSWRSALVGRFAPIGRRPPSLPRPSPHCRPSGKYPGSSRPRRAGPAARPERQAPSRWGRSS
jgi:hypothetical protein